MQRPMLKPLLGYYGAVPYESKSRAEPAKMKFLAVLLLVALAYAEPEAAPDAKADAEAAPWYYGYYGHPGYYGWGGYYGRRWGGYYGWESQANEAFVFFLVSPHRFSSNLGMAK